MAQKATTAERVVKSYLDLSGKELIKMSENEDKATFILKPEEHPSYTSCDPHITFNKHTSTVKISE